MKERTSIIFQTPSEADGMLNVLRGSFRHNQYDGLRMMVAFLKQSGLDLVFSELRGFLKRGKTVNCLVGRDFDLTEASALRGISELKVDFPSQVSLKIVQLSEGSTFHPKLYWFHGRKQHSLLIGSANFTFGGLRNNFEISSRLEVFANTIEEHPALNEVYRHWIDIISYDGIQSDWINLFEPDEELLAEMERLSRLRKEALALLPKRRTRKTPRKSSSAFGTHLVMDLTSEQGPSRISQVQPSIPIWVQYFQIDPRDVDWSTGEPPGFLLTNLRLEEMDPYRYMSKHDHNYTIEITGARVRRPAIIELYKISKDRYCYAVWTRTDKRYRQLDRELSKKNMAGSREVRRWFIE